MTDSPRIAAARAGKKTYTGKPCKVCGDCEKYVISCNCVKCSNRRSAENQQRVRELLRGA